jgi:hypothetical protein
MDSKKCQMLKGELEGQGEYPMVSIERFFDGNDDLGSIGCNLAEHPGIEVFRDVLTGLLERDDVEGVFALIMRLIPARIAGHSRTRFWLSARFPQRSCARS